jgi:hypothetical protein
MNGESNGFQLTNSAAREDKWRGSVFDPLRHTGPVDEETRDYLREKALVENMRARRMFADDDI